MKELTSWFSASDVFPYVVLIVCVPFPYGVWGRMCNSIISVPEHSLFINTSVLVHGPDKFLLPVTETKSNNTFYESDMCR